MEGLFAAVILTLINVLEILLIINKTVMPAELLIIFLSLVLIFITIISKNKSHFWDLILINLLVNILNVAYLYLSLGISLYLGLALTLNLLGFVFYYLVRSFMPMPSPSPKPMDITDLIPPIDFAKYPERLEIQAEPVQTGIVSQVQKTYSPGKYVASKSGTVYHSPKCPWAKKIANKNQEWFENEQQAHLKGYKKHNCVK